MLQGKPADGRMDEMVSKEEYAGRLVSESYDRYVISPELYAAHEVKRGLRDVNGKGVVTGLTEISEIVSSEIADGEERPCRGRLYFRGFDINDIVSGFINENRYGYEETAYLLLSGRLPDKTELAEFEAQLSAMRTLPPSFVRDIIMKSPSGDMMNALTRSVLSLFYYDDNPTDISVPNVMRQSLFLIAVMPLLAAYAYQAFNYYKNGESLFIHRPAEGASTAETLLSLLRDDGRYTPLEATILDLALVLHAEHGGGNNSTFTTHVVTSSGTDTYSSVAASLCSLKGPKHGGANIKVVQMFQDMKQRVRDWKDEDEIKAYLTGLLEKREFDGAGLIYGMGHAVYSLSDPRCEILRRFVSSLAKEKGLEDEYLLYSNVERLAPEVITNKRRIYKGVSANIDFYSGFIYSMLGLPCELYTPIFAVSRVAGWSAHRIEELINGNKIIRPAYKSVAEHRQYTALDKRQG